MNAIKNVIQKEFDFSENLELEFELSENMDFNAWSEWGLDKAKAKDMMAVWFAAESLEKCPELSRLQKENERLERLLGIVMMKVGEIEIFNMDVREFNKVGGYVEETRDGSFYRYKWINNSEQL